jgi:ABC-type antimicrobial peptide transport system permease subunit
MESLFDQLLVTRRFFMTILSIFGVTAVLIAAIGLYGVMAYIVTQRTKEIGVRMALGATTRTVMRSVLGRAGTYVATGLAIGWGAAWLAATSVGNLLFKVEPHDLRIYASAAAVLVAAGLIAAWAPARRAARVDPVVALRTE